MAFTEFKSFKLEKGLSLEERPRATTYAAAARLNGKVQRMNTETADYDRASRVARSWFSRLKADHIPGSQGRVTMVEAAKSFIRHIRAATPEKTQAKKDYHQTKWNTIEPFFRAMDVDAVTTPVLKQFMRWEKRSHVKPITQAKDFVTLRLILRHAVEEGWISAIPVFPRVGKLEANPRPWFTPEQWARLLEEAEERVQIALDEPGKHRHARMDIRDFIILQAATCMRVDELRSVRVCDVKVLKSNRKTVGGHSVPPEVAHMLKGKDAKFDPNEYLEIDLQEGLTEGTTEGLKRGPRIVVTRTAMSGVETFRSLVKRKNLKGTDKLFDAHHRDAFRELLIAAGLRTANGMKRNLKAVRCTGLMMWVLAEPNVNLKLLADNAGTSVAMLEQFYLKPLNVKMNRAALVG